MSSANLKSNRAGPPSRRSKPKCSTEARQHAIAISRTELKSLGLKTQPCRTPPRIGNDRLQTSFANTCPSWFRYKFWSIQIIWFERPCWDRARHNAGQLTRSNALDRSRLIIQIGTLARSNLSNSTCVVTKCSSTRLVDATDKTSGGGCNKNSCNLYTWFVPRKTWDGAGCTQLPWTRIHGRCYARHRAGWGVTKFVRLTHMADTDTTQAIGWAGMWFQLVHMVDTTQDIGWDGV